MKKLRVPAALQGFAEMNVQGWVLLASIVAIAAYGLWTGASLTTGGLGPL